MGTVNTVSLSDQTSRVESETISQATNKRRLCQRGEIGIPRHVRDGMRHAARERILFPQTYGGTLSPSPRQVDNLLGWVRDRVEPGRKECGNQYMVVEYKLRDVVHRQWLSNCIHSAVPRIVEAHNTILWVEYLPAPALHGGGFDFFRCFGGEAIPPIFGDCPIDDCSAVDAFPGIEGQKKV